MYYPPKNLTVDESLVLYKGRLFVKRYIRTKRARYRMKMFELATADDILLDFMIYQGNIEPSLIQPPGQHWLQQNKSHSLWWSHTMIEAHTLTTDNLYTTLRLAVFLLHRSTKVIGTVRSNRNNFPKDFSRWQRDAERISCLQRA